MSDFAFPSPVLVCDTGGTNVRFALSPSPGAGLGPIVHLITDDYPGLPEAIEAATPKLGARPQSMIVCGAGPVVGRELKLTNAPWVMDGPETARRAGLKQGLLLNDFEAQALSLPAIQPDWTRPIGALAFDGQGPQVILGPGTGPALPRWSRPTAASPPCRRRPAISTSARSRTRNSHSGRISSGRTGGSPARACSTARASRGSTGRA